jgi:outer membrane immunogenic protein
MKMRLLAGTAVAAVMAGSCAYAADIGPPPYPPIYAPAPPPPQFSWTGCHAGTNFGLGSGHNQWTDTQPDGNIDGNTATARTASINLTGGVVGGQIGCDVQFGGNWLIGVAGMFNGSDIAGTDQDQFNAPWTLSDHVDWYGSVTGRIGTAVNHVLLYGKGGAVFAHNNFEIENGGVTLGTPADVRVGWTAGLGLEWAFSPNWSVFLEGNYYGFPSKTETFNFVPGFINMPTTIKVQPAFETFSLGVNYRFGLEGMPWRF